MSTSTVMKPQNSIPTTEDLFSFNSPAKLTTTVANSTLDSFPQLTLQDKHRYNDVYLYLFVYSYHILLLEESKYIFFKCCLRIVQNSELEKRHSSLSSLDPAPAQTIKSPQPGKYLTGLAIIFYTYY